MALPAEESNVSNPIRRIRWATQRVTGSPARRKRHSLLSRLHKKTGSTEKKGDFGYPNTEGIQETTDTSDDGDEPEDNRRRIFFNMELPNDAKDVEGHPLQNFGRNKIRTAKYTPLSFVPKNLWFQFHNVANVYFLFVIILGVRRPKSIHQFAHPLIQTCRYSPFLEPRIPLSAPYHLS